MKVQNDVVMFTCLSDELVELLPPVIDDDGVPLPDNAMIEVLSADGNTVVSIWQVVDGIPYAY